MTGTDSGRRKDVQTSPNGPPPKRRYSLSRLFLNFYLFAMGSFVAIAFFADFVISTSLKGITDDYARRFMQGTIVLIEEDLGRYPHDEWPQRIKTLDDKFSYKLALTERGRIKLNPLQLKKLESGDIAVGAEGDVLYHRIKGSHQVLAVGPLSPDRNPEYDRGMPLELRVSLLTWSLIGLCFAVAVWFWVRPMWRDLESLRQTARALGEGDFETRAPAARSRAFDLLAETVNGMAERIQRLIATQKELSSAISHELRTPIARLRFALEMLTGNDDKAEQERLRRMMEGDIEELDNLIDSSLTYSRFEREKPEPHLRPAEISPWIVEQVDNMRVLGRDLEIETDLSRLPPGQTAAFDRKNLPYALKNLLRNAIKYARTRIVVSAEIDGDRILVHVDDDGIGIPEEDRERVFAAFTRLDRSRDRATGGYGLGLAIARLVLEQHGGTASAAASPLGGARFTLGWPLSAD